MGDIARLDRARHIKRARRRIKALLDEGLIEYGEHALARLRERGLDAADIESVIRWGRLTRGGESAYPRTPRRYVLEGKGVGGEGIVCVVDTNGVLVVVSAWPR